MDGKTVLGFQLETAFKTLLERAEALDAAAWNSRSVPGTSKFGFILWHCGRTIDWGVHRGVRGVAELADLPAWSEVAVPGALAGFGISAAVADSVPERVSREQFLRYVRRLREVVLPWFADCSVHDLERPVDLRAHLATAPAYLEPDPWSEVADLDAVPAWQVVVRPCVLHVRGHLGEFGALLEARKPRPEESPAG